MSGTYNIKIAFNNKALQIVVYPVHVLGREYNWLHKRSTDLLEYYYQYFVYISYWFGFKQYSMEAFNVIC